MVETVVLHLRKLARIHLSEQMRTGWLIETEGENARQSESRAAKSAIFKVVDAKTTQTA